MKTLLIALTFTSYIALANAETFKLPNGTTYRAQADGFDCGTFGPESDYVVSPLEFSQRDINFIQLSADKDLNNFLIELSFPSENSGTCTYGAYFIRNRETVRLDFNYSSLVSEDDGLGCTQTATWLDQALQNMPYEASKRGFRYVAVTLIENEQNDVCAAGNVRIVFDRR